MWILKATKEGNLMFEIRDKEGFVMETIMLEDLEFEEELFIKMFEGEMKT